MNVHRRRPGSTVLAALMATVVGVVAGAGTASAAIPVYTHPGQVESFQPFSAPLDDFSGVGVVRGRLWAALGKVIYRCDYATNTFSDSFTMPGISGDIVGMRF